MNLSALGIDVYQLTTLAAHARAGRLGHRIAMACFFRKMPRHRNYVVFAGLRQVLDWCRELRLDEESLRVIERHPVVGPALRQSPEMGRALAEVGARGFEGDIDAVAEGTLAFAGPGRTTSGEPLMVGGAPLSLYTPLLQVRTDMTRAKLLETPWLARVNHMSMVASKAARVVTAAAGRPVLEFGQRRTHPAAAIDASYAAYMAGCSATSNLAAEALYAIPSSGTMDHFAVQASEEPGVPPERTEQAIFKALVDLYPESNALLVDTYDTEAGTISAARTGRERLRAIRLDSNVTPELVRRARQLLDENGAPQAKIFVSDGLDEWRVRELGAAGADGFGVGENITCSPDSPVGVGCVGKIVVNGYGKPTMKISKGSGKATLPGWLQVFRAADHDLVALEGEPCPAGSRPLLVPVWRGNAPAPDLPSLAGARAHVARQIALLPEHLQDLPVDHGRPWSLVASDRLVDLVRKLAKEAAP
ncbi:MAG: hypothetical protein U0166_27665 [Acidobacteriota bacterium]